MLMKSELEKEGERERERGVLQHGAAEVSHRHHDADAESFALRPQPLLAIPLGLRDEGSFSSPPSLTTKRPLC